MIIEATIEKYLVKYLGYYLDLDNKILSIGIWKGEIYLENVGIKQSVVNHLQLPLTLVTGNCQALRCRIPWKNIGSQPIVLEISNLFILVSSREEIWSEDEKARVNTRLADEQVAKSFSEEVQQDQDLSATNDGWDKVFRRAWDNLELKITNVHIRYENEGVGCSMGFLLKRLSVHTTDESGRNVYVDRESLTEAALFKEAQLDELSAYWNSDSSLFFKDMDREAILVAMGQTDDMNHLLHPLTGKLTVIRRLDDEAPHLTLGGSLNFLNVILEANQLRELRKISRDFRTYQRFLRHIERQVMFFDQYKPKVWTPKNRWLWAAGCVYRNLELDIPDRESADSLKYRQLADRFLRIGQPRPSEDTEFQDCVDDDEVGPLPAEKPNPQPSGWKSWAWSALSTAATNFIVGDTPKPAGDAPEAESRGASLSTQYDYSQTAAARSILSKSQGQLETYLNLVFKKCSLTLRGEGRDSCFHIWDLSHELFLFDTSFSFSLNVGGFTLSTCGPEGTTVDLIYSRENDALLSMVGIGKTLYGGAELGVTAGQLVCVCAKDAFEDLLSFWREPSSDSEESWELEEQGPQVEWREVLKSSDRWQLALRIASPVLVCPTQLGSAMLGAPLVALYPGSLTIQSTMKTGLKDAFQVHLAQTSILWFPDFWNFRGSLADNECPRSEALVREFDIYLVIQTQVALEDAASSCVDIQGTIDAIDASFSSTAYISLMEALSLLMGPGQPDNLQGYEEGEEESLASDLEGEALVSVKLQLPRVSLTLACLPEETLQFVTNSLDFEFKGYENYSLTSFAMKSLSICRPQVAADSPVYHLLQTEDAQEVVQLNIRSGIRPYMEFVMTSIRLHFFPQIVGHLMAFISQGPSQFRSVFPQNPLSKPAPKLDLVFKMNHLVIIGFIRDSSCPLVALHVESTFLHLVMKARKVNLQMELANIQLDEYDAKDQALTRLLNMGDQTSTLTLVYSGFSEHAPDFPGFHDQTKIRMQHIFLTLITAKLVRVFNYFMDDLLVAILGRPLNEVKVFNIFGPNARIPCTQLFDAFPNCQLPSNLKEAQDFYVKLFQNPHFARILEPPRLGSLTLDIQKAHIRAPHPQGLGDLLAQAEAIHLSSLPGLDPYVGCIFQVKTDFQGISISTPSGFQVLPPSDLCLTYWQSALKVCPTLPQHFRLSAAKLPFVLTNSEFFFVLDVFTDNILETGDIVSSGPMQECLENSVFLVFHLDIQELSIKLEGLGTLGCSDVSFKVRRYHEIRSKHDRLTTDLEFDWQNLTFANSVYPAPFADTLLKTSERDNHLSLRYTQKSLSGTQLNIVCQRPTMVVSAPLFTEISNFFVRRQPKAFTHIAQEKTAFEVDLQLLGAQLVFPENPDNPKSPCVVATVQFLYSLSIVNSLRTSKFVVQEGSIGLALNWADFLGGHSREILPELGFIGKHQVDHESKLRNLQSNTEIAGSFEDMVVKLGVRDMLVLRNVWDWQLKMQPIFKTPSGIQMEVPTFLIHQISQTKICLDWKRVCVYLADEMEGQLVHQPLFYLTLEDLIWKRHNQSTFHHATPEHLIINSSLSHFLAQNALQIQTSQVNLSSNDVLSGILCLSYFNLQAVLWEPLIESSLGTSASIFKKRSLHGFPMTISSNSNMGAATQNRMESVHAFKSSASLTINLTDVLMPRIGRLLKFWKSHEGSREALPSRQESQYFAPYSVCNQTCWPFTLHVPNPNTGITQVILLAPKETRPLHEISLNTLNASPESASGEGIHRIALVLEDGTLFPIRLDLSGVFVHEYQNHSLESLIFRISATESGKTLSILSSFSMVSHLGRPLFLSVPGKEPDQFRLNPGESTALPSALCPLKNSRRSPACKFSFDGQKVSETRDLFSVNLLMTLRRQQVEGYKSELVHLKIGNEYLAIHIMGETLHARDSLYWRVQLSVYPPVRIRSSLCVNLDVLCFSLGGPTDAGRLSTQETCEFYGVSLETQVLVQAGLNGQQSPQKSLWKSSKAAFSKSVLTLPYEGQELQLEVHCLSPPDMPLHIVIHSPVWVVNQVDPRILGLQQELPGGSRLKGLVCESLFPLDRRTDRVHLRLQHPTQSGQKAPLPKGRRSQNTSLKIETVGNSCVSALDFGDARMLNSPFWRQFFETEAVSDWQAKVRNASETVLQTWSLYSGPLPLFEFAVEVQPITDNQDPDLTINQVVIAPQYSIVNYGDGPLRIRQANCTRAITLEPGQKEALWWSHSGQPLRIQVALDSQWSGALDVQAREEVAFPVWMANQTYPRILEICKKYQKPGIILEIRAQPEYSPVLGPGLKQWLSCIVMINSLKERLVVSQAEVRLPALLIPPDSCLPFAWPEPMLAHVLVVQLNGRLHNIECKSETKNTPRLLSSNSYFTLEHQQPMVVLHFTDLSERATLSKQKFLAKNPFQQEEGPSPAISYSIELPGLVFSLVYAKELTNPLTGATEPLRNELNLLKFSDISARIRQTPKFTSYDFFVQSIQLDTLDESHSFPVFVQNLVLHDKSPVLHVSWRTRQLPQELRGRLSWFENVFISCQELALEFDNGSLRQLGQAYSILFQPVAEALAESAEVDHKSGESDHLVIWGFSVDPIKLCVSFAPGNTDRKSDEFLFKLVSSLGALDNSRLAFEGYNLPHMFTTKESFLAALETYYRTQLLFSLSSLLTSIEILGNPAGLVSNIGTGLKDIVVKPIQGAMTGDFLDGFGRGAESLGSNVVFGAMNSVSKVTSAASRGLGVLSLDSNYENKKNRDKLRNSPAHAGQGAISGLESFGKGVFEGITGVVTNPIREAEHGIGGFLKGAVTGTIGLVTKPVCGILDMTSLTAEGIRNQVRSAETSFVKAPLIRPPRMFYGCDRYLGVFSQQHACERIVLQALDDRSRWENLSRIDSFWDTPYQSLVFLGTCGAHGGIYLFHLSTKKYDDYLAYKVNHMASVRSHVRLCLPVSLVQGVALENSGGVRLRLKGLQGPTPPYIQYPNHLNGQVGGDCTIRCSSVEASLKIQQMFQDFMAYSRLSVD